MIPWYGASALANDERRCSALRRKLRVTKTATTKHAMACDLTRRRGRQMLRSLGILSDTPWPHLRPSLRITKRDSGVVGIVHCFSPLLWLLAPEKKKDMKEINARLLLLLLLRLPLRAHLGRMMTKGIRLTKRQTFDDRKRLFCFLTDGRVRARCQAELTAAAANNQCSLCRRKLHRECCDGQLWLCERRATGDDSEHFMLSATSWMSVNQINCHSYNDPVVRCLRARE